MDKSNWLALSKYRFSRAGEMLNAARRELEAGDYFTANNRAYYCVFHAMRAVLALDGMDFKKHSGVIAKFAQCYLKTDLIPRRYGELIRNASLIRNRSDYTDFYTCSVEDTKGLIAGAAAFYEDVRGYLEARWQEKSARES